jgi:hypothetical protein
MNGETSKIETKNIGNLFSPEAVIMLPLAIFFDLIGITLLFFALDDFFITDIIAMFIFGTWFFFRSGTKPDLRSLKKGRVAPTPSKKLFGVAWKELIPYLGAFPWWTIAVWRELTS